MAAPLLCIRVVDGSVASGLVISDQGGVIPISVMCQLFQ